MTTDAIAAPTINNALDYSKNTSEASKQLSEDYDDFLLLLTTQLQNQDPLDPADTTEFTNQLIAFSGVEQQINTNKRLDSLVSLSLGNSFSSAINYVGKDINYLSSEAYFDGSQDVEINYAIEGSPAKTTLNIIDKDENLVFSKEINPNDKSYIWDGYDKNGNKVDTGTYNIRIDALDSENKPLKATTVISGHVNGVETQNGTTFLLVGDRAVSVGNIINVKESSQVTENNTTTSDT